MDKNKYLVALFLLLGVCSCSEVGDLEGVVVRKEYVPADDKPKPTLVVGTSSLDFDAAQGQKSFTIESNGSWTIEAPDWCSLSVSSGSGNATITVSVGENLSSDVRSGNIVVSGTNDLSATIKVTQQGKKQPPTPSLTVGTTALTFEAEQGQLEFTIESNTSWTIEAPGWCTLSKSSGAGDATITVSVGENPSTEERSGNIVVSGTDNLSTTIKVTQKGKTPPPPTLTVGTSSLSFEAEQGQLEFTIESNTSWMIEAPGWCTLSKSSGTGDATITVSVGENPSYEERSGNIVVSGPDGLSATIKVSQKGKDSSGVPGPGDNEPPTDKVLGTYEKPISFSDAQQVNNSVKPWAWVKAVIVGYVSGNMYTGATFGAFGCNVNTNILISGSVSINNPENCMPMQLPNGALRNGLNLKDNPNLLGKEIIIYGQLADYFGVSGIISPKYAETGGKSFGTRP